MRPPSFSVSLTGAAAFAIASLSALSSAAPAQIDAPSPAVRTCYEQPVSFENNQGQAHESIHQLARGPRHLLTTDSTGFCLTLAPESGDAKWAVVRLSWQGGADSVVPNAEGELPGKSHFLRGQRSEAWVRDVASFARVRYPAIYPGIDLLLHGRNGELEYDFLLAPGADPTALRLRIDGAEDVVLNSDGSLRFETPVGEVKMRAPLAFQGNEENVVPCQYRIVGKNEVEFELGEYDRGLPLIIDPILIYGSYLGGSEFDGLWDMTVDEFDNIYLCGETLSDDFPTSPGVFQPTVNGSRDAFVVKFDANRQRLWSTYLGGTETRPPSEYAAGIAVDDQGNVYVTGDSSARDFPTTPGAYNVYPPAGGFVSKLSPDGSTLLYSTLLHGADGLDLEVTPAGDAIVTGLAHATFIPTNGAYDTTFAGLHDAFLLRLNGSGTDVHYATFLGGADLDTPFDLYLQPDESAVIGGSTQSPDYPTSPGAFDSSLGGVADGFISAVSSDGSALLFSTFVGGSDYEWGAALTADGAGLPVLAGTTYSLDHPTTPGAFQETHGGGVCDFFVTGIEHDATGLRFSTYVGGAEGDGASAVTVDGNGNLVVTGFAGAGFPVTTHAWTDQFAGVTDVAVVYLDASARDLHYGSYYGGSDRDTPGEAAVLSDGSLVISGSTVSTDLPVTPDAFQSTAQGQLDAHLTVFSPLVCQESIGYGGPGDLRLTICGDPLSAGNGANLLLRGVPPNGVAFLAVSLSLNPTPFKGGIWGPLPLNLLLSTRADGTGTVRLDGIPGGNGPVDVYIQAIVPDDSQVQGFALSEVLLVRILP